MRIFSLFLILFGLLISPSIGAQTYPCTKAGSSFLADLSGVWQVSAKDRTSPGNYEENTGVSTISWAVKGCSIQEVYEGTFKGRSYAVNYTTYLTDSLTMSRTFYDSEHGGLMKFEGTVEGKKAEFMWYRDASKKRMQVKNGVIWKDENSFETISQLSTDNGETWQLTHHWVYSRK